MIAPKADVAQSILALQKRQEAELSKLLAQKLLGSVAPAASNKAPAAPNHNSAIPAAKSNSATPAAETPTVKVPGPKLISKLEEAGFEDSNATKTRIKNLARQQASKVAISAGISLAASTVPKSLKLPPLALPPDGWSNSKGEVIIPSPPLTAPDPGKDCVVGPTPLDTAA